MKNSGFALAALVFALVQLIGTNGKAINNGDSPGRRPAGVVSNEQEHKISKRTDSANEESPCAGLNDDCNDSPKERIALRSTRSLDDNVEESMNDMAQKRSERHHRHHHHHHHHHHHLHKRSKFYRRHKRHRSRSKKMTLKSSKSKVHGGSKRTPNVKLHVQFKGPNLSGTLESSDPLNPKEGDLTLQAVQNAEQGDLNYAQALANQNNFDNPFNGDSLAHQPLNDEAKGDVVVQASRMPDGTVQTSTSIKPKKADQAQNQGVSNPEDDQLNGQLQDLLKNSFKTSSTEDETKNKDTQQSSSATTSQTAPKPDDNKDDNKNKTNTLKGLMETINLLKAISSPNATNSSTNDAKTSKAPGTQNVEPSKNTPTAEASKETSTTAGAESKPSSDKDKSESSSKANSSAEGPKDKAESGKGAEGPKDKAEPGKADEGPKDKAEPGKGEKAEEKDSKSDSSKGSSSVQSGSTAKDSSKSDSSGGKTIGSGILLLINKKTNNSNDDTNTSKTHGVIIMPNIGTAISQQKSDQNSSEDKNQAKSSDTKSESNQNPTGASNFNNVAGNQTPISPTANQPNNDYKSDATGQPSPTMSNLLGLIGNLVQDKLQNKLNQTGAGPKVTVGNSTGMKKQDLDKNLTIGKINIALQTTAGTQNDDPSSSANSRYHPTVAMKPIKSTISFQFSPGAPNKEKVDAFSDQSHSASQGQGHDELPSAQVQYSKQPVSTNGAPSAPVMRIRLRGHGTATAAMQDESEPSKDNQNSIIINALRNNGNSGRFNDALKKPLHTTTVIIKNYHKDAKPMSYGPEDPFDTMPVKGSDTYDAFGNKRPESPVISMNDADDLLAGDKALIDNSAMQNSLFNPVGTSLSGQKEDTMKIAQNVLRESEFHPGLGDDEDFAQALLHQDDMPRYPNKMAYKEKPRVAPARVNLPSAKAQSFQNQRFKSVGKPQIAAPHGPVVTGYNNYGPQPMGMPGMQNVNDSPMGETGISMGQGVQMGGAGTGGGRGTMPVEMQPISANDDDVNKSMNQALNNMQDMAMKQIQDKFPGMQITMKANDEEDSEEGQQEQQQEQPQEQQQEQSQEQSQEQQESGDNAEDTSSGANANTNANEEESRGESEPKKDKENNEEADKGSKEKDNKEKSEKSSEDGKEKEKSSKSDKSESKDKKVKENDDSSLANQAATDKAPTVQIKHIDPREMCKEKPSGVYANDADPSKFIICYNGVTEERQCSNGMVFNPREKVCEPTSDKANKLHDESKSKGQETKFNDAEKKKPQETRARPSPFKTIT